MPKISRELTVLEVRKLGQGTFAVGGARGLYLRKSPKQSFFFLRYSNATGRHDLSLGSYPETSLAEARKRAVLARIEIDAGECPVTKRKQASEALREKRSSQQRIQTDHSNTFEKVARTWIKERVESGFWANNKRGESNTVRLLEMYAFPLIGDIPINQVTAEHLRDCLKAIWQTKPSSARKLKSHFYKIFQFALATHLRTEASNPASRDGALTVFLEPLQKNRKPREHHAACDIKEIPRLFEESRKYRSISARCCEFAILTAARSKAVRLATWDEFDLDKGIWTVPADHDKLKEPGRDRTIFLSSAAISLLKSLIRFADSPYVFPSSQGSHFSDVALTMFLRGLHEKRLALDGRGWIDPVKSDAIGKPAVITIHGTARASFQTWTKDDELGNNRRFDQEAVELCLFHSKKDALGGAYDRARLTTERRAVMEAWGRYCLSTIGLYSDDSDISDKEG